MVHCFKKNGYNIVLDVNSGCVHQVDDVAYDMIEMYETHKPEEIIDAMLDKYGDREDVTREDLAQTIEDIEYLKEQGQLFTDDLFESVSFDFKKRQSVLKALCLHVAQDCNLSCKYCFAGEGEYHGERGLMSFETGKRALDFLIENSGTRHNLEVDFFGGEPLMNWEVVKQLVAYGRSKEKEFNKNFRFTITTNGMLINDEVIDFCNKEMGNVVLSMDGRKVVNDRMRSNRAGRGSYDTIVPKFQKFVEARGDKEYYMRGTFTHYNVDFLQDILHMADLGFKELSIEPVVAPPEADYALREEDLPTILEQYDELAVEMLKRHKEGRDFTFYHYMIDLDAGPCVVKRISGCGVGTEYLAVNANGDLYPCHQFAGEEKFKVGNVYTGITDTTVCDEFKECNIYSHKECSKCFARMYCSGGCAANAMHTTGSITGVYEMGCEIHRNRIENALMLQVAMREEEDGEVTGKKAEECYEDDCEFHCGSLEAAAGDLCVPER